MYSVAKLVLITILGEDRVVLSYCTDPPVNLVLIDYKGPGGWVCVYGVTVSCSEDPSISNKSSAALTHKVSIWCSAMDDKPGPLSWLQIG